MEEGVEKNSYSQLTRIVITGPESTGKTLLCERLAKHYSTLFIPEYAREYILSLRRRYKYEDVVHIAKKQIELEEAYSKNVQKLLFYDTYLIITKVWLEVVYNHCPAWIDHILKQNKIDLYLVCAPDIPWIPDGVRENGGEMRYRLHEWYITELEHYGSNFRIISGEKRFEMANKLIDELLNSKEKKK